MIWTMLFLNIAAGMGLLSKLSPMAQDVYKAAQGITDPATVLPVQIYVWADSPERAFVERTAAAIVVLLVFLVVVNAAAVILRKRFERRW